MVVYQVEFRWDVFVDYEHFRNKRKALKHAKSIFKHDEDMEVSIVRKIDTGKAKPFDLVKMFGDFCNESFLIGAGIPHSDIPSAVHEIIFEQTR